MALKKIEEAVTSSARNEAEHIIKAAQHAAKERLAQERAAAERDAERHYHAGVRAIDDEMGRRLLQAKGNAGKQLLERRNAVLARVFELVWHAVLAWPTDKYVSVMRRYLERAAGQTGGYIRIHPHDKDAFTRVLASFNAGRPSSAQVALDESRPLEARGGFIYVADTYEVDQTLDTLLAEFERELAPGIASELFGSARA